MRLFSKKPPPPEILSGIPVRVSSRARRMALRMDSRLGDVVLVWPKSATEEKAARFIDEHKSWIAEQRRGIVPTRNFDDGVQAEVQGVLYTVRAVSGRGLTRISEKEILVHGAPEYRHRRVKDFLKKEAARILSEKSAEKAARLDIKIGGVRVIDPKTRWGSCSTAGTLMYSWRLILAPTDVLDYVVAHEVAHRVHMNHGRKFWALCLSLCDAGAGTKSRKWLRDNGAQLLSWR